MEPGPTYRCARLPTDGATGSLAANLLQRGSDGVGPAVDGLLTDPRHECVVTSASSWSVIDLPTA